MSDDRPDNRHHGGTTPERSGLGGEPSPFSGAARGLAKVAGAVGALVAATAVVAAVVAVLY